MRVVKWLLLFVALLAAVPIAAAAALRERSVAGPLSAVGIAGTDVGYADAYRRGCHEVRHWDVATRGDVRVASHCFVSTSTGSGVAGVAVTDGRTLWLTYTGGNIREWSLWTKGGIARTKRIAFKAADVDGPAPIVLGSAWEESLPYAVGRTIVVLSSNGSRRFSVDATDEVRTLSAHSRGYAAVLANGSVLRLSLTGRVLGRTPYPPGFAQFAVLAAQGLVVKTVAGLEIHRNGAVRRLSLPAGSRFLGLSAGVVAYGTGRQLRLRRLSNGNDVLFRTLTPRFEAQLGRLGIVYASGRTLGYSAAVFVSGAV